MKRPVSFFTGILFLTLGLVIFFVYIGPVFIPKKDARVSKTGEITTETIQQEDAVVANIEYKMRLKSVEDESELRNDRPEPGEVIFKLKIPDLKKEYSVRESTSKETLKYGPGHISGTSYPWEEEGNCGISAHRVTYGGPFRYIHNLTNGDILQVVANGEIYRYRVVWKKRVKPDETWVLNPTSKPSLTLTTCGPPFSAKYRLVIRAVKIK